MRFSLRSLLFATALVAVICGVFVLPGGWPILVLPPLLLILLAGAAAGAVFGASHGRAFCIGYLAAGSWIAVCAGVFLAFCVFLELPRGVRNTVLGDSLDSEDLMVAKVALAAYFVTNLLGGLAAVGVRWTCLRRASPAQ